VVPAKSAFAFFCLAANLSFAGQLQDAAKSGNVVLLKQALDKATNLAEVDAAGDPALILASLEGHADAVELILEKGADIEVRNKGGLTALHAAAYAGKLDVVKLLVAKGAQVNDTRNFYKMSPLHAAAEEGHSDVAAFLIESKADIEATERNGYTPLTQAGWRGYWDVGEILLKAGAVCQKAELVGEPLYNECMKRKSL
jgi:uncharacterized protein